MARVLRIDPRPPSYDSVAEAIALAPSDEGSIVDDVEHRDWRAVDPPALAATPDVAFVDGVERREARVSAEGEGMPFAGMLASYAAGAMCPGKAPPLRHVSVERRIVLTRGARPSRVALAAGNAEVEYLPAHNAEDDPESLDRTLKQLRADLEASVVRSLIVDGVPLIIVDGRLPPGLDAERRKSTPANAVGFIKTPHRLPIADAARVELLCALHAGQRSPVFVRRRSDRSYYSWFVCLAERRPFDLALSNLALLEMDDQAPLSQAIATADVTAALLPSYASTPYRDARAPQNLLPVGQLERELRHRLGDSDLLARLMVAWFAKEERTWEP
jgi:hypothetical protein